MVLLPVAVAITNLWIGLAIFSISLALAAGSATDLRVRRLPDSFTLVVGVVGLSLSAVGGSDRLVAGVLASAIVGLAMGGLRLAVRAKNGDPGLGFGDVKLCMALALWLGVAIPWAIATAAGLGLVFVATQSVRPERIPFGPFLASGGIIAGLVVEGLRWHSV